MKIYLPQPQISEESQFQNQFYSWLNDSHYWIEQSNTISICKWCNQVQPMTLYNSTLCLENPEILKLKK